MVSTQEPDQVPLFIYRSLRGARSKVFWDFLGREGHTAADFPGGIEC